MATLVALMSSASAVAAGVAQAEEGWYGRADVGYSVDGHISAFGSEFDLRDGGFGGGKAILQSVGRDYETIRRGRWVVSDDPLFFKGEAHAGTIANTPSLVKKTDFLILPARFQYPLWSAS